MKNKLADLNNHLFAQLERLSDENLSKEQVELEAKRGKAVVAVADQIIKSANIQLQAVKLAATYGAGVRAQLPMLENKPAAERSQ